VILRMIAIRQLSRWSDAETAHCVADSLVLRPFCRVSLEAVPDDTPLIRWANLIGPPTRAQGNDRVVELARALKVTRGRKLRTDTTVGETTIHHPTDSRILGDGVRVLSRLLRRAKDIVTDGRDLPRTVFRSHTRSIRRLAQEIRRVARRQGEEAAESLPRADATLIGIAEARKAPAEHVRDSLAERADPQAQRLVQQFAPFLPLVDQAIAPATRRVICGRGRPRHGETPEPLRAAYSDHRPAQTR
jgi:IS5 family transposase